MPVAAAPGPPPNPEEFPKVDEVLKDYAPVVSTNDGARGFYRLWRRDKDQQLLAELPRVMQFDSRGEPFVQMGAMCWYASQMGTRCEDSCRLA